MQEYNISTKKCIRSDRIYFDELEQLDIDTKYFVDTFEQYNIAKIFAYNYLYDETFLNEEHDKTAYLMLKETFGFDAYQINNLLTESKMMIESQKELITQYKSQTEESIKSIKKKIKTTKKKITQFETNQRQIIKYYKMKKNGKDLNKWTFKNYPFAHHGLSDRNKLTFFTYYDKDVDIYQYSCFVDSELKKLRHRLGQLKFALHRNKEKLNKLNVPKRVCFGGRKLFKSKDTTNISYENWKRQLHLKKYSKILCCGRADLNFGNSIIHYNENHDMQIELLQSFTLNGNQKNISKSMRKYITIPNVKFPYGQELIDSYMKKQNNVMNDKNLKRKEKKYLPIAYQLSLHVDKFGRKYMIISAIITLPTKTHVNYTTETGVVSIDINVDHIALTELNKDGCLVHQEVISYDVYNKPTGSVRHEISRITEYIIRYCKKVKKCLVVENLDLTKKKQQLKYQSKKVNKLLSGFAYVKIFEYLNSKAYKYDIFIYKINPAYTSQIGKLKYMRQLGVSIHIAAAYVIGRRGMGFKEKIPTYLKQLLTEEERQKKQWSQYAIIAKKLKSFNIHYFYKNIETFDI